MSRGDTTIAVVVYNAADHITPLFESIKRQTKKPYEVMVVVDFPEDNTIPALYKAFPDGRALVSDEPKIYGCRNHALRNCRSKYLAFTDSDCVLDEYFVENIEKIFKERKGIVGITGRHPRVNPKKNIWNWIHQNRFRVEMRETGLTDGVIGANSAFRTTVLKEIKGWPQIPGIMGAEDVAISKRLLQAGYKIWYDKSIIVNHHYKSSLKSLVKQEKLMAHDIIVMMNYEGEYGFLYWYTLAIPAFFIISIIFLFTNMAAFGLLLLASFVYMSIVAKSPIKAFPQWMARMLMLPAYSYGVIVGLTETFINRKSNN